jgi:general secretion pathway protein M
MDQIQQLKQWYRSLPQKEQWMVSGTGIFIIVTLFYLLVWEPIHLGLQEEKQKQQSQQEIMIWMQDAASEVKALRASGSRSTIRDRNKAITLVIEQSINNAGLKAYVNKIESSGSDGARVTLNEVPFNQVLVWLNTLATYNGVQVVSANIERASKPGHTNVRLSFERP